MSRSGADPATTDAAWLERLAEPLGKTDYGQYLLRILDEQGPRDWAGLNPGLLSGAAAALSISDAACCD